MAFFRKPAVAQSKLFRSEPGTKSNEYVTAHIDGGARGNPGPAGYGVLLLDQKGRKLAELCRFLGHRTNNFAEYSALLAALEYAVQNGCKALQVYSDSELLVRQMRGEYKMKSPDLRPLFQQAQALVEKLEWFRIEHVRREANHDADRLANEAMDSAPKG